MSDALALPMLRTSERTTWRRCPQKWWWAYREGLRPPGSGPNALWFGTGIHLALALWYEEGTKRGPHPAETFGAWVGDEVRRIRTNAKNEAATFDEDEFVDAHALGVAMLKAYVDKYGTDERWHVIAPEHAFQIQIPSPITGKLIVLYCGTYDLVYRDLLDDTLWLGEHKSYKVIDVKHLPLDDQTGSYWAVATSLLRHQGTLKRGERIEGITYNILRKALPDDRPKDAQGYALNMDGSRSKRQPLPNFHREQVFRTPGETRTQLARIADETTVMQMHRRKEIPLWKNPTRDCSWDCSFFPMCELHEQGQDWEEYRYQMYKVEDPYADHRKSAAE